ncbi:MAG: dipeptide epimerase [Candidatus Omnitrophica bacterium]|nr:dipeptide epimerase [Candidatus Omnitrophota bacterium]
MKFARIVGSGIIPLKLSMRQSFVTSLGEKRESRNLLVALKLDNGAIGLGEASSSLAWPKDTPRAMTPLLRKAAAGLLGNEIRNLKSLVGITWEICAQHPAAAAALECALWDAYARAQRVPLWRMLGGRKRSVTTSLTLSAWPPARAALAARRAYRLGFRRLKVKVTGRDLDEDIRRVAAVHRAAPRARLWVDANQGFQTRQAIRFALAVKKMGLPVGLFEQPVFKGDVEGLARVQQEGKIPVAADESARTVKEVTALIQRRAVSAINLKLAKTGLWGSLKIVGLAQKAGVRLMIGCMAESAIGLAPSVHLACGTGAFRYVDLDSHLLVVSPPCRSGFVTRGAQLLVHPTSPGCGTQLS